MPTEPPGTRTLVHHDAHSADHTFLLDVAWAAVGGSVVLAACALIRVLSVSGGGSLPSSLMPGGSVAAIPTYYPELGAFFMAGFLVVLVARSVSDRMR